VSPNTQADGTAVVTQLDEELLADGAEEPFLIRGK